MQVIHENPVMIFFFRTEQHVLGDSLKKLRLKVHRFNISILMCKERMHK